MNTLFVFVTAENCKIQVKRFNFIWSYVTLFERDRLKCFMKEKSFAEKIVSQTELRDESCKIIDLRQHLNFPLRYY